MQADKLYLVRELGRRSLGGSALRYGGGHGILLEQGHSRGLERQVGSHVEAFTECTLAAAALGNLCFLLSTVLVLASGSISPPYLAIGVGPDRGGGRCHSCPTHPGLLSCASALTAAFCLADS